MVITRSIFTPKHPDFDTYQKAHGGRFASDMAGDCPRKEKGEISRRGGPKSGSLPPYGGRLAGLQIIHSK